MSIETVVARVHASLDEIENMVSGGINFPLEAYVDAISLNALCGALRVAPKDWRADELMRILLIRDGLYDTRNRLRDVGDDAEHSLERLLSVTDRLYADLERALRDLDKNELDAAQGSLAEMRRGPQIPSATIAGTLSNIGQEANALLAQTSVTHNHIEVNLLRIERSQLNVDVNVVVELLKSAQLKIRRLSANVFAIKLQLEQTVIFQGIYKFLTNGADKVVSELKELVTEIKRAYATATDFVSDIVNLAEKGGRFSRLVADMLGHAFGDDTGPAPRHVDFRVQKYQQSDAILSGLHADGANVLLGNKDGYLWTMDVDSGAVTEQERLANAGITSIAKFDSQFEKYFAIGTEDGLEVTFAVGRARTGFQAPYREHVAAVATPRWGDAIVTGTRDGIVRRWSLAGGLSQHSPESTRKIDRSIQRMTVHGERLIAASGEHLQFLDEDLNTVQRVGVDFKISDMVFVGRDAMIVCGAGHIAHVNLQGGIYSRFLISSSEVKYSSLAVLDDGIFCVGTEDGFISAIDFSSGEEIGRVDVGFPVRGLLTAKGKLIAYGGDWKRRGRSAAILNWREVMDADAARGLA